MIIVATSTNQKREFCIELLINYKTVSNKRMKSFVQAAAGHEIRPS